jgi:hypothetical protein
MTDNEKTSFGLAIGLAVLALILLLGVTAKPAQAPGLVDRAKFASTWNDIEAAVVRLNSTRHELGDSVELYAPWFVNCEPQRVRRRALYDAAARDAEVMAKRYRQLRDLEQ